MASARTGRLGARRRVSACHAVAENRIGRCLYPPRRPGARRLGRLFSRRSRTSVRNGQLGLPGLL